MIEAVRGRLVAVGADHVVVEVGGWSLRLLVPVGVCDELSQLEIAAPEAAEVRLATHLLVRPDAWQLFGFRDPQQRDLFRVLLGVPGIGPRLAVGLLSYMSLSDIAAAATAGDAARFQAVPGVGKRTAARIVVELAGKLQKVAEIDHAPSGAAGIAGAAEAVEALVALGLGRTDAQALVRQVTRAPDAPQESAAIVSAALRMHHARR